MFEWEGSCPELESSGAEIVAWQWGTVFDERFVTKQVARLGIDVSPPYILKTIHGMVIEDSDGMYYAFVEDPGSLDGTDIDPDGAGGPVRATLVCRERRSDD